MTNLTNRRCECGYNLEVAPCPYHGNSRPRVLSARTETLNETVIARLNAFAARGMAAEADALAYCREMVQRYPADDFSFGRFMDNFRIAARANDAKVQA